MIQGFEEITKPLNDYERGTLLPLMVSGLRTKTGSERKITSSAIIAALRRQGYAVDGPRVRKIVNYIRINGIIPCLVSTSKGYFVATTAREIDECISSLRCRVSATQAVIDALQRQKENKFNQ